MLSGSESRKVCADKFRPIVNGPDLEIFPRQFLIYQEATVLWASFFHLIPDLYTVSQRKTLFSRWTVDCSVMVIIMNYYDIVSVVYWIEHSRIGQRSQARNLTWAWL